MPATGDQRHPPRIGIPYRTYNEQVKNIRGKYEMYLRSVENAGGVAVQIPLDLGANDLERRALELDAILLPGSPADVDPGRYHAGRHRQTADADIHREATDLALLRHCFDQGKPVLAICYGVQILNVYLGGSLVQDIPSEVQTAIEHRWPAGEREPYHGVRLEKASRMAPGQPEARVNSSHHQSIREPGRGLSVTARADDGVIEAVELAGDASWVIGVQWHPERMTEDALAQKLFQDFVAAARTVTVRG